MEAGTEAPTQESPEAEVVGGLSPEDQKRILARRAERERKAASGKRDTAGDAGDQRAAVKAVSDGEATEEELLDATEWFLSEDTDESVQQTIKVNIGTARTPKYLAWTIRPVDMDTIRRIRKDAQRGTRAQRRAGTGEMDDTAANIGILLEGTVEPDVIAIAGGNPEKAVNGVKHKFRNKPGLIGLIVAEILSLSGYDDEDVQEVDAAKN